MALEELLEDAKRKNEESYVETEEDVDLPLLLKNRNTDLDDIQDEEDRYVFFGGKKIWNKFTLKNYLKKIGTNSH